MACAAVAGPGEDSGRTVGAVYAANTLGAIVGALGVSLVLIPWIGTQNSQRVLLLVSAVSALFVLVPGICEQQVAISVALLRRSRWCGAVRAWRGRGRGSRAS